MTASVTVACKIPNGLLLQHNHHRRETRIALPGGLFAVENIAYRTGPQVKINGNRAPYGEVPKWPIRFGYGFTEVDAEWWEEWWAHNQDFEPVKAKLLFAWENAADTEAQAKEHRSTMSGMEPLNPGTKMLNNRAVPVDPRWPRTADPKTLSDVGTMTEE